MVIAAALILTVFCFIAVAIPLLRNKSNSERDWSYEFEDSTTRSGSVPALLKQLETDYKTGILSEEDYHSLQNEFQAATAGAMGVEVKGVSSLDEEIENRVAGLRGGGKAVAGDEIEEKIRQLRRTPTVAGSRPAANGNTGQAKAPFCSQCGAKSKQGDRFCARCGNQLT